MTNELTTETDPVGPSGSRTAELGRGKRGTPRARVTAARPVQMPQGLAHGEPALTTLPMMAGGAPPAVVLEGVRLDAVDEQRCVSLVMEASKAGRGGWIVTPNLDHLRRLLGDTSLRARYGRADLVVADGMPLVWACRLQNTPIPGRVAGSDLICSLSRAAAERGLSVFFLGGDPGTAEAAARSLCARFEGLRVAGTACPAPGFEDRPGAIQELAEQLADAHPDVIFVALGSPKQEALIERLRPGLPAAWWMGVGISFSFVSGRVKRAPVWLRKIGCEWLHRLAQEPRRLARRYLLDGLPFAAFLMGRSALRGLRALVIGRSGQTATAALRDWTPVV